MKVYHPEIGTKEALDLYLSDTPILISELSRIELLSTIYRKYREREINSDTLDALLLRFQEDVESRYELLEFTSLVLENATRLMAKFGKAHSLKTLDTLQFAFFTTYADKDDVFVCSDHRLANFARVEGSAVYVPKGSIPEHREDVSREAGRRRKLFLSPPHMGGEELPFVQQAFESNYIAPLGPMVDAFEREFAKYVGIRHCAAVASGTAAMHLALRCLGVGPGDEVFASTLTFIGSVTPVVFQGAELTFVDCDRTSWNMDPDLLKEALADCKKRGKLPKAVVPTDLYGQCVDYERIFEICEGYGVPVVADAAEALGAMYLTQRRKG